MTLHRRGSTTMSGTSDGPGQTNTRSTAVPTGVTGTDVVVLIYGCWASGAQAAPSVTWPTGFAGHEFLSISVAVPSGGTIWLKMAWGTTGKATSGSYTVTTTASYWCMFGCQAWYDDAGTIDQAAPIETSNTATQGTNATTVPSVAVTTTDNAGLGHAFQSYNDATASTAPTGFTKEDGNATVLHVNSKIATASGTQTASGATTGAVSTVKAVGLYAVKAASAGGTTVTGTAAAASSLVATVTGKRTVKGTAAGTSTLTAAVSGKRRVSATVTGASGLAATVAGTRTVIGAASAGSSLTGTGSGSHGVAGSAAAGFGFSAAASGTRIVRGSASASSLLTATVAGTVISPGLGSAQANLSLDAAAFGVRTVTGAAAGASALTATAAGAGSSGPATVTGTASAATVLDAVAAGSRTVAGSLVAAWSLTALLFSPPPAPPGEDLGTWLTLGDLMDARATHELIMLDVIGARHPGMVEDPFDPVLGYAPAASKPEFYHGKATVQARQISAGQLSPAGLGTLTQLGYAVHGPVGTTLDAAAPGDVIEVYESADPRHTGLRLVVRNVESSSFVTARRLVCTLYEPSTP